MFFPALVLFFFFLLLSAFFSSSETAFVASNPLKIDFLEKKGSKAANLVREMLKKMDSLLATILIGNTLVNTAAASVSTFIFVSFMPDNKNQAVLLSTVVTTFLILVFSEINPKTYAAYHPIKLSLMFVQPIRFFIVLFFPLVKTFTFVTRLIFPSQKMKGSMSRSLSEEEIKLLFTTGVKGMSSLRRKMISGVLDIGSRPIREIMVPRPEIKAIEMGASFEEILEMVRAAEFSRFPVYRDSLDNIEGIIHAKAVIPYLIDKKDINLIDLLRKPFFVPESASLEKVMLQMQASTNQLVFVVDEFGNMEGIVTLEDIIEELVGEIQDEYDAQTEDLVKPVGKNVYAVKGSAPIKDVNRHIPLDLPESGDYTTAAGFFLAEFGRIPQPDDSLEFNGHKFIIKEMGKRRINTIHVILKNREEE